MDINEIKKILPHRYPFLLIDRIIEFVTEDPGKNPLMGWESSSDTYSELNLEFKSKDLAIEYARKNNILFEVIDPQKRNINKKSYADNFIK